LVCCQLMVCANVVFTNKRKSGKNVIRFMVTVLKIK